MSELVYIGGFSGGIDSQATARFMLNRYGATCVILVNSDAGGNEHPLTIEHIDWYSTHVHPVVRIQAIVRDMWMNADAQEGRGLDPDEPLTFVRMAEIRGIFPSRKKQFCTDKLKLQPIRRWIHANYPEGNYARFSGVRRDESHARTNREWMEWDDFYDCELYNPVFDWSKQMCFDYVKHHGEQINLLYSLGFTRVGCAPCVNSNKDDILHWAIRFPEMIDKVRAWEMHVGRIFFRPAFPAWPSTGSMMSSHGPRLTGAADRTIYSASFRRQPANRGTDCANEIPVSVLRDRSGLGCVAAAGLAACDVCRDRSVLLLAAALALSRIASSAYAKPT